MWDQAFTTIRRGRFLLAAVVIVGSVAAVPALRESILRAGGRALVVDEPIHREDVVVIAVDAGAAGVLEAADLVHEGVATRVAVFLDPPDPADREFVRRGVPYEDAAARTIRQLKSLGVDAIEAIPRVSGTEDEGKVLRAWCEQHGFKRVAVVTTADHSRRVRRVLNRSMRAQRTRVSVRVARHSSFNPEHWWHSREGLRTGIIELQKLLLDYARHPAS